MNKSLESVQPRDHTKSPTVHSKRLIIIHEVDMHPHSILEKLTRHFEKPSIIKVYGRDTLRQYQKAPVFDKNYLVIFDSVNLLESNLNYIKFDFMIPVIVCQTVSAVDDVIDRCRSKNIPYSSYENKFSKKDAIDLIRSLASEKLTDNFCEKLVERVGRSPTRILSAIMVFEQVGYKTSNINKYIDKYRYIDSLDVIDSLLGVCKSKAQAKRAYLYLHQNRLWYKKYTRVSLCKDLDTLISIFNSMIDGELTSYSMQEYMQENRINRHTMMYATYLFEKKSLTELMSLRLFLEKASILEVILHLS